MRGLYPIVDIDTLQKHGISPLDFAEKVLLAAPPLLQLRAKNLGANDTLKLLRALRPLCTAAGTRLIANDRPDLALLAACDGVHIGQEDLPISLVRKIAPGLLIGLSTHNESQLTEALTQKPDYVAFGPVFSTQSKANADPAVGVERLSAAYAAAKAAGIPLVAIGGISLERAREIAGMCDLIAVIGALLGDGDADLTSTLERARELHAVMGAVRHYV